mgnify:CR=1 FL=1
MGSEMCIRDSFKRMQVVLKRMVKCRVLTQQQADAIAADAENLTV